ncbi:unnamed protein product [Owenia fusiformis]|uniref:G-protein coupled receptors family 1 profile domain-containing protein n=1 Tax=Owenia fusiformis TaxID=6347 RepID=A0A8S4N341_OWEFU|nr:unnamed protein product [Owenia fusiformis]
MTTTISTFVTDMANSTTNDTSDDANVSDSTLTEAPYNMWADPDNYVEHRIAVALWKYLCPVVILIGVVGSVLTIMVMQGTGMKRTTPSVYLTFLATADALTLLTGALRHWINYSWEIDIRDLMAWICKTHHFVLYLCIHLSGWLLVAVSIDRVITVYLPLQARFISTKRNALIISTTMVIILGAINSHWFLTYSVSFNYGELYCQFQPIFEDSFDLRVWMWVDLALSSALPFLILIVSNIMISVQLARVSKQRNEMGSGGNDNSRSMTVMLLSISVVFVCLTLPMAVYLTTQSFSYEYENSQAIWRDEMTYAIVSNIAYINNAINFFLYCVSGSKFRGELAKLCGKKKSRKANNQSMSVTRMTGVSESRQSVKTVTSELQK